MILLNGELVERNQVNIDLEDRGYQFGDGIYEVVSVYHGNIFRLQDHLKRLTYSLSQLEIELPLSMEQLAKNLQELIQVHQLENGQIYFQVTRGYAPRVHSFPEKSTAVLTGYVTRKPRPLELMKTGAKAITTEDIRWLRCDIKSLNLLGNVLAKQKAVENGAYETIQHRNGIVTEGSSSNVFIVKKGALQTHPLNNLILGGITRIVLLEIANKLNIPVLEQTYTLDELFAADEVFVTSTTSEVMPIVSIDGRPVKDGKPGVITSQIQEAFFQLVKEA
jgi:D-alanine transaminase